MGHDKTILLLRHAKSAWGAAALDDHDRPLNRRGERAARTMADHIAARGPRPELILCSTAARTRQTLTPLLKALGAPLPTVLLERELYLASEDTLLERLQALPEDLAVVLLIGHNDGIGQLARDLAGQGLDEAVQRLREKFSTAALAVLRLPSAPWGALAHGTCELLSFSRPRDFDQR